MPSGPKYSRSVFVNCPFDDDFRGTLNAISFAIYDCGFVVRSALEIDDGSEIRLEKIFRLMEQCEFAIHDLSRTELDGVNHLPRFNMPLEMGIFLGAKRFGKGRQKRKRALILDKEPYRYQKFISDIAGQDIHSHDGHASGVIKPVRDWLAAASKVTRLPPGAGHIAKRYDAFIADLPKLCEEMHVTADQLTYADHAHLISIWLQRNASTRNELA